MTAPNRVAVVLFNLGGPDRPEAVRPFLYNLFSDRAIIRLPWGLRHRCLGDRQAAPVAQEIYQAIGGGSPILKKYRLQAMALSRTLGDGFKCFIAMRYWHPRADETARAVRDWQPNEVILLPLYPQFSSTTTGSSVAEWIRAARSIGMTAPTRTICCWPEQDGFIATVTERLRAALRQQDSPQPVRILFSAHGLPKQIVTAGDPYQSHVERTAASIRAGLPEDTDSVVCYQSRVGPLEWLGPSTESEIHRAGRDGVGLIVCPVAFVSEHSETLVELDIEYRRLAETSGVTRYERVGTVDADPQFITGLARLVAGRRAAPLDGTASGDGRRCDGAFGLCPCVRAAG